MSRRERIRRYVDGELDAAERAALEAEAARDPSLGRELRASCELARALRAAAPPPEPPADLVDKALLRAVRHRARAVEEESWVDRWMRPRTLRVRVTPTVLLVGLTAAVLFAVWIGRGDRELAMPAGAPAEIRTALVRLTVPADGAHTVAVAGDFNDWRTDDVFLEDPEGDGVFVGTLRLPPGSYAYMFVIDGERWVTDPYAVNRRDDGFGNQNAILRID